MGTQLASIGLRTVFPFRKCFWWDGIHVLAFSFLSSVSWIIAWVYVGFPFSIVVSLYLRFMTSDYLFDIFQLF